MSTTYHIHEILSFVLQELVEEKEDPATANFRNELSLTDGVDIHTQKQCIQLGQASISDCTSP